MKPPWLKILPQATEKFTDVRKKIKELNLHTVCEEAHCPNISECWSGGTATFMVMGDTCTRGCRFCNVKSGRPNELDEKEPENLAQAVKYFGLEYVVITSVDRDDLPDQGSGHFARCIEEIKKISPKTIIEVLIPDFRGNIECLEKIIHAGPHVIAHNIETVRSLQRKARDVRANYDQSLSVLKKIKEISPEIYTKSSLMLGLGETEKEVIETMNDLKNIGVDVLTFGQYLRPSSWHLEVIEYVSPEKFNLYKKIGEEMSFLYIASGPFVRSSYRAAEFFLLGKMKNNMGLA